VKFKVWISYWNCKGPCEYESLENYQKQVPFEKYWKEISRKHERLQRVMMELAKTCILKKRKEIKEKWSLKNYQSRSTMLIKITQYWCVLNCFWWKCRLCEFFTNFTWFYYSLTYYGNKKKLEETDAELLELANIELRERFQLLSREVIVPFPVDLGRIKSNSTTIGIKQILDLSVRNAKFYSEQLKQYKL
jgi:excinuclease ABC subunit C